MIIDVHAHYHPRRYIEALSKATGRSRMPFPASLPDTDDADHVEQRLAMMQAAGVGLQVLSPAAGLAPYGENEAAAVEAARIANDLSAELVSRHAGLFKAFVSLPLPHIDASLRELERGLDELAMIGVNLHISALDRSVAEDEFLPIYEELNRRAGFVFYHPAGNGILSPYIRDYGFNAAVGTSLEDSVIGLHLIGKKIPARFPNVTFVIPHLGGIIPMLLQRLDNQFSMRQRELPEPPSVTARRFYYDTVGHGSHAALTCAWKAFGADHIMPGSDFPVLVAYESYARTFVWIREAGLPEGDVEQILERTAPAVLGLN
jgi:predicted TIM-barrel fold metal-dependent hydrolase